LVGHWKFDENASVSVAADSSGNNLHATIGGAPIRLNGVRNGAFHFDGNDDRVFMSYDAKLALSKYTVSLWIYPERNNEAWTGLFGREGRTHALFLGNSNHVDSPFIHHRFSEGTNWNQGVANFSLSGWNQWYHIVGTNGGVGSLARTFVNGTYLEGNAIREIQVVENLGMNTTAPLNFGVGADSATSDGNFFLGKMDDVRLYSEPLGIEDIQVIYRGESNLGSLPNSGSSGTVYKATTPTLPALPNLSLAYGQKIVGLDLGEQPGMSYTISNLPDGLTNLKTFLPTDLPGLLAWYAADRNDSFEFHPPTVFERNDTVGLDDLLLGLEFEEANGSVALDSTGNGYHAKVLNPLQWASGKDGGGVSFHGDNDGIFIPKDDFMNQPSAFSLSLWFNRSSEVTGTSTNNGVDNVLVAQSSAAFNDNFEIGSSGSELEIYFDSGTGSEDAFHATSGAGLTNGVWNHLTVTYGNGLKVYLNGSIVLDRTEFSGPMDSSQDSPLSLGVARVFFGSVGRL
jgi:hypothetical protein